MYVEDIGGLRSLRPSWAFLIPIERRAIRFGKLLAGELFLQRERVRNGIALLKHLAEQHFGAQPKLDRSLLWAVSEYEDSEDWANAGAAVFVAREDGGAKEDALRAISEGLLDQLGVIHAYNIETLPNANLELDLAGSLSGSAALRRAATVSALSAAISAADGSDARVTAEKESSGKRTGSVPGERLERGLALLQAVAVGGQVRVCPRGTPPVVIELLGGMSRDRIYGGKVEVEGHVDGLRWSNLSFSVHGALRSPSSKSNGEGSGRRFFSGKVDAKIYLTLLQHFVNRSICIFELDELVDPASVPGKGSTYEMSSFKFLRKPDLGLFDE